ncbi:hypothetical protein BT96DRAFT_157419 [Gymnopus androsaceus JB14]|uniref:Uncharacterized protein n=1 Tax=Gymnopus androsaceus JB14 TaxID=1447944 RepID=A0A6A4HBV0_9AGAR|nr:hypothetical protein BT96DRAFT_157419 [Gymnopus androsaceus JB14]
MHWIYGPTARSLYRSLLSAPTTPITSTPRLSFPYPFSRFASSATDTILHSSSAPAFTTPLKREKKKKLKPKKESFQQRDMDGELEGKMNEILFEWAQERDGEQQRELRMEANQILEGEEERTKNERNSANSVTDAKGRTWLDKRVKRLKFVLQRDKVTLQRMSRMVGNEMRRIEKHVIKKKPRVPLPPSEPSKMHELFVSHLKTYFLIETNQKGTQRLVPKSRSSEGTAVFPQTFVRRWQRTIANE